MPGKLSGISHSQSLTRNVREGSLTMTTGRNNRDAQRLQPLRRIDAPTLLLVAVLAAAGWTLWTWAANQGDGEAWDHGVFWSIVLPSMAFLSLLAGWLLPRAAALVGLALVLPQAVALFTTSGITPLALAGIVFFVLFVLACSGIAIAAANVRNRLNQRRAS